MVELLDSAKADKKVECSDKRWVVMMAALMVVSTAGRTAFDWAAQKDALRAALLGRSTAARKVVQKAVQMEAKRADCSAATTVHRSAESTVLSKAARLVFRLAVLTGDN